MISKFAGKCGICGKPTKANVDHYDVDTKEKYHEACRQKKDLFAEAEANELADCLGFRPHGETVAALRAVLPLPSSDRSASAGRD